MWEVFKRPCWVLMEALNLPVVRKEHTQKKGKDECLQWTSAISQCLCHTAYTRDRTFILQGRFLYQWYLLPIINYIHFEDEKTGSGNLSNLPKFTQPIRKGIRTNTWDFLPSNFAIKCFMCLKATLQGRGRQRREPKVWFWQDKASTMKTELLLSSTPGN